MTDLEKKHKWLCKKRDSLNLRSIEDLHNIINKSDQTKARLINLYNSVTFVNIDKPPKWILWVNLMCKELNYNPLDEN